MTILSGKCSILSNISTSDNVSSKPMIPLYGYLINSVKQKTFGTKWMLGHSLLNIYKSDLSLISLIWLSTDLKTDYKAIFVDNIQCERYPIFVYYLCSYTAKATIYLPESRIRITCDTFELDAMPTPTRPRELATKGPDT